MNTYVWIRSVVENFLIKFFLIYFSYVCLDVSPIHLAILKLAQTCARLSLDTCNAKYFLMRD